MIFSVSLTIFRVIDLDLCILIHVFSLSYLCLQAWLFDGEAESVHACLCFFMMIIFLLFIYPFPSYTSNALQYLLCNILIV